MTDVLKKAQDTPHRYVWLDAIRGIALVSMIAYHAMWDLVYIAGVHAPWYKSAGAHYWQQSICITFILVAGFSGGLTRRNLKNGLLVFGCGALIMAVTCTLLPEDRVVFGVLTLIGSCGILLALLRPLFDKLPAIPLALVNLALFVMTKPITRGWLNLIAFKQYLPESLYSQGYGLTYLGFPFKNFYSTDYFPLLPWVFLYLTGFFICRFMKEREIYGLLPFSKLPWRKTPFPFLGRHSLLIYMLHQPVLYGLILVLQQNKWW